MALIYIVEDDESIGALVRATLGAIGHEGRVLPNAQALFEAAAAQLPGLLILDIMLPGQDGFDILSRWRDGAATREIPVIMLSALSGELDKVRALEMGAEDYITKPFGVLEMQARVKAALRRRRAEAEDAFKLGDLQVDYRRKKAFIAGAELRLTPMEMRLLEYLCRNAPNVVSRDTLIERVWDREFEGETTRTVDYHVRALRKKLGDTAEDARYIETVRGFGYRMRGQ